jgi:malyl-CoA/(S)-citramalyl-CoA lyase
MEEAAKQGKGAVSLDGRLIDAASIRMARNLVARADQIRARSEVSREAASDGGGT